MLKNNYIDIMEKAREAYSYEHLKRYVEKNKLEGLTEHGFPRLTADIGILLAHGRCMDLLPMFYEMMDLCCSCIPLVKNAGNEFSIKEIVFSLMEIEKANIVPKNKIEKWYKDLALCNPYDCYRVIAGVSKEEVNNWAVFSAISEWMRQYVGLCDATEFINRQLSSQIIAFDENGMYRDPDEPMVYDVVTRLQFACLIHFGYDGSFRSEIVSALEKSAEITLDMQSVNGELPFGGRSNQMLPVDAAYISLLEFYASYYKKAGEFEKMKAFKVAANCAFGTLEKWLLKEPKTHVKNNFSIDSKYGCEEYAYFDKYMITVASNIYLAYLFADDSIETDMHSLGHTGKVVETSRYFHKVFGKCAGYYLEIEKKADIHYDASGLGRIHYVGAPEQLVLSVPFSASPNYIIDKKNDTALSLCATTKDIEGWKLGADGQYEMLKNESSEKEITIKMKCALDKGIILYEDYVVNDMGVTLKAYGNDNIGIMLPIFDFDGLEHTETCVKEQEIKVLYNGWCCTYTTDGIIEDTNKTYQNRNGFYKAFRAVGNEQITVHIRVENWRNFGCGFV